MLSELFHRLFKKKDAHAEAVAQQPTALLVENHLEAAASYQITKKPQQALVECEQALQLDPNNATAYRIRAQARYGIGDVEGAREDWAKALHLNKV